MTELTILKDKLSKVINAKNKTEIVEIINSLNEHKTSEFFKKNIINLNLELKDNLELEDFRFHSLLTIQQTMIEVSGLSLFEIQNRLRKK